MDTNVKVLAVTSTEHILYIMFFKAPEPPKPEEPVVYQTAAKVTPPKAEAVPSRGIDL